MWTKEQCNLFFKRTLGLDFTSSELDIVWDYLMQHKLTPILNNSKNNTIGFSPQMLKNLINIARERLNTTLQNPRFKKVSEEIMPALVFTLFLKKIGYGEYLIVSTDIPDIALIKFNYELTEQVNRQVDAFPVEAMFINEYAMRSVLGKSDLEKISKLIISKKFYKKYISETVLIITLNLHSSDLNLSELSDILIKKGTSPFHQLWVIAGIDTGNFIIVQVCPEFKSYVLNASKDLLPLMY